MKFLRKYGLGLIPMQHPHLDLVRKWRNAPHVRNNFEYQQEISPPQHLHWFEGLDLKTNWYWIIESGGQPIGVVHVKEIDLATKRGEAGVFIGEATWLGSPLAVMAIAAMMDHVFQEKGLESLCCKIRDDRPETIRLNRDLGYRFWKTAETPGFSWYQCTRPQYLNSQVRKLLDQLDPGTPDASA